jgi:DNA invertase Pin-like site-specific DNA recombinase
MTVHAPDRLARRYAHLVLLIEELRRAGVEVVFLNCPIGGTAEDAPWQHCTGGDQALLRMGGAVARQTVGTRVMKQALTAYSQRGDERW